MILRVKRANAVPPSYLLKGTHVCRPPALSVEPASRRYVYFIGPSFILTVNIVLFSISLNFTHI